MSKAFIVNEKEQLKGWRGVVLAPPAPFVFQFQDPVDGMLPAEAEEAARLAFEEESPFPAESVGVGLVKDEDGRIGIFGCERSKLPDLDDNEFLIPAFFPFLGWDREPGAVELAQADDGCSLLVFEQGGSVPSEIIGFANDPEDGDPPWPEIEGSASFLGIDWPGRDKIPLLQLEDVAADSRGRFRARIRCEDGSERSWVAGPDVLWNGDLRPQEMLQRLRRERAMGERIWRASRMTVAFLGLLLLAQSILWGLEFWVGAKERRMEAQAEAARQVEDRAGLSQRLADLGKSRLSVFRKLGELNLLRPDGVQFVKVNFEDPDQFRVEGRAPRVRVYNSYVDRLRNDPRFTIGEMDTPRSRDGRIDFELNVRVGDDEALPVDRSAATGPDRGEGPA